MWWSYQRQCANSIFALVLPLTHVLRCSKFVRNRILLWYIHSLIYTLLKMLMLFVWVMGKTERIYPIFTLNLWLVKILRFTKFEEKLPICLACYERWSYSKFLRFMGKLSVGDFLAQPKALLQIFRSAKCEQICMPPFCLL